MSGSGAIEVAFGPDGDPQFIASARDYHEYLYELGDDGWRLTTVADDTLRIGSAPPHPDVEDALWRGAAALTGSPDTESVTVPIIPGGALHPSTDSDHERKS